jgi:hypothetical protein
MPDLILTPAELKALTGYRQPSTQLAELKRQGFWRARRSVTGRVIVERSHYEAVCRGEQGQPAPKVRQPVVRMA